MTEQNAQARMEIAFDMVQDQIELTNQLAAAQARIAALEAENAGDRVGN